MRCEVGLPVDEQTHGYQPLVLIGTIAKWKCHVQKISKAIDLDPEEYNRIADNSLKRFQEKFSIENYVDRIIFEYNELLISSFSNRCETKKLTK